jgi:alpha-galactosidase
MYEAPATLAWFLVILFGAAARPDVSWASTQFQTAEIERRDQWLQDRLLTAAGSSAATTAKPVFSFLFDDQSSNKLLAAWASVSQSSSLSKGRTQYMRVWSDAKTGLQVRCIAVKYADFPVVEWTVYFKNSGKQVTPLLANLQAIDTAIERAPAGEYVLKYNRGDTCAPDLYQPLEQTLTPGFQLRLAPAGGRGTNQAFPYYNLSMPGGGLILAVGWPGQWATTFSRDAARGLRIAAGQELTHLVLRPGEEVRTPLIALLFWEGADAQRAQNLWRRWMIAHNLPRAADGQLPAPIMPGNTSGEFNEMCNATEKDENQFIDRYVEEQIPIDYWWMDAGWYPCNGWPQTGTWEPDLKRFPGGLRAISDHARAKGIKTLVWFEPERVAGGTWLAQNHPEWLLGNTLLNLGDPAARTWLTDHTDKVLREQGIDLYRQDFNMDPLDFWRRNDVPERQGMTENLHVQGYLAYWDALRVRHPNLRIDSCASGGRRNDLETLRRAVPLHPTDYNYGHLAAKQAFHQSLFQWIPYFGSNTVPCDTVDAYTIRSGHAMSVVLGYDMRRGDLDYALLRKLTREARQVVPYYYGDFYPLLPYSLSEDAWIAWQFHRPESADGLVEAFRRPRSQKASILLKLRGLDADAVYEIKNSDVESPSRATGRNLMEKGLPIDAARRPQAFVIMYKRLHGLAAVASASQSACEAFQPVAFSAADSQSPGAGISAYHWDFGDKTSGEGATVEHTYRAPGTYTVKLTVADRQGRSDSTDLSAAIRPEDTTQPAIVAAASADSDKVRVVFNEPSSLWVNPAPTQTEYADILGNHGEPFVGINLQQDAMNTNCFGFGFGDGRKWQGTGSGPLKANEWQHLAVVCDGETAILYVNGAEKNRGPGKAPVAANPSQNFKLGQGYHSGRYFHGKLSDVRIYREALSAAEIAELRK